MRLAQRLNKLDSMLGQLKQPGVKVPELKRTDE
jgi:hypothetical protein